MPFQKSVTFPNRIIRVAVMGSAKVGKTGIVHRFVQKTFSEAYTQTVEDMYRISLKKADLEIVDTAGAYSFPAMRDFAICTADAFILVFAWDDNDSFEYVRFLMNEIQKSRDNVQHIIVAGNKMDLSTKTVSFYQREMVVLLDWDKSFMECSAKEDENITKLFEEIVTKVMAKRLDGRENTSNLMERRNRMKCLSCVAKHDEI